MPILSPKSSLNFNKFVEHGFPPRIECLIFLPAMQIILQRVKLHYLLKTMLRALSTSSPHLF